MTVTDQDTASARGYWLRALKLLWTVSPWHVSTVLVVTALSSLVPAATVALTTLVVQSVSDAVTGGASSDTAVFAAAVLAALSGIGLLLTTARGYFETLLQYRMANSVQEMIMRKATRLQLQHFEDAATYDKLQRANREAAFRPYQIFSSLISVTSSFVTFASVSVVLLSWHVLVALVIMLAPLPSMLANVFYSRVTWKVENARSSDRRRLNYLQFLVTTDRTYKETRLFDLGSVFVHRFRDLVDRFYAVDRSIEGRQAVATGLLGTFSVAASAGGILFAVHVSIAGGQVGQVAGYIAAIAAVQSSVQTLVIGLSQLYEHNLFIGNLFAFLAIPERTLGSGGRPFPARLSKGIEFRDVTFSYPGTTTPVLDGLNIFLPAGKCVALVGQNGAGKTTIVKLLARFYAPTGGSILIDDVPVEEYDLDDLRANIGVIFQDFVQYEASARENIGFGRIGDLGDNEKIHVAAEQSGASGFLRRLPGGMDAQLGRWFEEGNQLSGGEWQKVALARAFLRGAPVAVLDEPTAAIDAEAEADIFGRLRQISSQATTMLIAHRFSTVRVADHIVVIDRGRVLEEGSHTELMAQDGVYAKLFNLQAAGYLEDSAGVPATPVGG